MTNSAYILAPEVGSVKNKKIYILHHLGMGDHLHCNGLVRHLVEKLPTDEDWDVVLFCWERNFKNVKYLYRDDDRIIVVPFENDTNEIFKARRVINQNSTYGNPLYTHRYYQIGYHEFRKIKSENPELTCDQCFYKQLDVPYEYRFDKFYYERDSEEEERVFKKLVPEGKEYVFVHDNPHRDYIIDLDKIDSKYKIVKNDETESIFHFAKILENASEIHCIESSFRCFIEGLNTSQAKHYFHPVNTEFSRFDKNNLGTGTSKEWTFVEY